MFPFEIVEFADLSPGATDGPESRGAVRSGGPVRGPLHVRMLCRSSAARTGVRVAVRFVADIASEQVVVPLAGDPTGCGTDSSAPSRVRAMLVPDTAASRATFESLEFGSSSAEGGAVADSWPEGRLLLLEVDCPDAAAALAHVPDKYLWHVGALRVDVAHDTDGGQKTVAELSVVCQMRKEASNGSAMTRTFMHPAR